MLTPSQYTWYGVIFLTENNMEKAHSLILENRKKLTLTGVNSVDNFDENSITLKTGMGVLSLRGENLNITEFSVNTGEAAVTGNIFALVYTNDSSGGGFFSRLFK